MLASTPEEPAVSYREKNGNVWGLRGTRCADSVDAIRSMLNGPARSTLSERRRGVNIASRDRREKVFATSVEVVGIYFTVNKETKSTGKIEQLHQQRVSRSL